MIFIGLVRTSMRGASLTINESKGFPSEFLNLALAHVVAKPILSGDPT